MPSIARNVRTLLLGLAVTAAGLAGPHASAVHCTDFDPPPGGWPWPCCGTTFVYDGIEFNTRDFRFWDGTPFVGGFAEPQAACNGAPGLSLNVNNVNLDVKMDTFFGTPGVQRIRFSYRDAGGNVNLGVNGHLEWAFDDFHLIPAAPYAAVGASVITPPPVFVGGAWEGEVIIEAMPGQCITQFSFGGQELCVDDLCGEGPCPCPGDVTGDGLVDVLDLLQVMADWGLPGGPSDINGDGLVDVLDLLIVLAEWGGC
jgi:hypothetical protein